MKSEEEAMEKKKEKTELVVIGGGPGGYAAAFRAADLGLSVILIEKEPRLGGTCLLWGCIPSKALLHASELIHHTRYASQIGLQYEEPQVLLEKLKNWKEEIIQNLSTGLSGLSKRRKVKTYHGSAEFKDEKTLLVKGDQEVELKFEKAIIATGSKPNIPPCIESSNPDFLSSKEALEIESIPPKLLVIGAGVISLELGLVYSLLGSEVTVVEMQDEILPGMDKDLKKVLTKEIKKEFKEIYTKYCVKEIKKNKKGQYQVLLKATEGGEEKNKIFDKVLYAIGRTPLTQELDLEKAGVEYNEKGFILTDTQQRTNKEHIFAIGDVCEGPMLAHKASYEGRIAAQVVAGHNALTDALVVPSVVYTYPEVAWCGLQEDEAIQKGFEVQSEVFPWAASGRAMSLSFTEGLTKLVFEKESGRVLGAGVVGPQAGELIMQGVLMIEMGATAYDVASCIHPHPSLSETFLGCAELFLGECIELYKKRKK